MTPKIIGEVGLSHEGSLGVAIRYVEALAAAGVDAVKFQMHLPEFESTREEPFRNAYFKQDKTRFDYWKRTAFSPREWQILRDSCVDNNIEFVCTPFSRQAIDRLVDLGVATIKVGSGDFNNTEMLEYLTGYEGQLILSTGMATEDEIISTSRLLQSRPRHTTAMMHCTSMYPTPEDRISLGYMERLRELSGFEVGYSDHSGKVAVGIAALTLGAKFLEAHVVFDRRQFGVDASSSLTVDEFESLAHFAASKDLILTQGDKNSVAESLAALRQVFGRSLCVKADKPAGSVLVERDFIMKKPGGGLSWDERKLLIGRELDSEIDAQDPLALRQLLEKVG